MNACEDILLTPLENLENMLSAAAPGRERDWADRLGVNLTRFIHALQRHVSERETTTGMFSKVDQTRPSLVRQVSTLRRDHDSFLVSARELREELRRALRSPRAIPDLGSIRSRLEELTTALRRHREEESGLVIESVTTDLGAGD